jgi:hypothetical protein
MSSNPIIRGAAIVVVAATCAACSSDATDPSSTMGKFIAGTAQTPKQVDLADFRVLGFCPATKIRAGTQTFRIFQRGKDEDPTALRYQAGITKTARECRQTGDILAIKVGVAGKLVTGPKGTVGSVRLPLRIAILAPEDEVIYSKLHVIEVQISDLTNSTAWIQVDDQITVPLRTDIRVVVGFDYKEAKKMRN